MDYQEIKRLSDDQQVPAIPPAPAKRKFPPGYRFMPTDAELIVEYLQKKIANEPLPIDDIKETYLKHVNPMDLTANFPKLGDNEWYFFTPRDRKYPNGQRPDRGSDSGYWKATGADKHVTVGDVTVGFRKSLVFYEGKPMKGVKTKWIMHEFRANGASRIKSSANDMRLDDWVICRIYEQSLRQISKRKNPNEKEQNEDINAVYDIPLQDEVAAALVTNDQENLPIIPIDDQPITFNSDWPSLQDLLQEPQNGYFQSNNLDGILIPLEKMNNNFGNPYLSDEPLVFQQQPQQQQPNASSSWSCCNDVFQLPDPHSVPRFNNDNNNNNNGFPIIHNNNTGFPTVYNNNFPIMYSQTDAKQEDLKRSRRQ